MSARDHLPPLARYLCLGLLVAAAGAVVAAINHVGVAIGFASGATTQEEIAGALTSELVGERWGLVALLLVLAAVVLGALTWRTRR